MTTDTRNRRNVWMTLKAGLQHKVGGTTISKWLLSCLLLCLMLCLHSCAAPEWKLDNDADELLSDGEVDVGGFRIRPPASFLRWKKGSSDSSFHNYTSCIDGSMYSGANMISPGQLRKDIDYFIWYDDRPASVRAIEPMYKGSTETCETSTNVLQKSLKVIIKTAAGPNNDENLKDLYRDHLERGKPVGFDFNCSQPEFGTINQVRFIRGTWTAQCGLTKYYPLATTYSNYVPAKGVCYVTIVDGQAVSFIGTCPGDESIKDVEQSILSFHQ